MKIGIRAWDGEKMIFPEIISQQFPIAAFPTLRDFEDNTNELKEDSLMLFSGITDKKGCSIYEGDIVKGGCRIMIVKYNPKTCQFWLTWNDNGINRYEPLIASFANKENDFTNYDLEVIGNIYLNP